MKKSKSRKVWTGVRYKGMTMLYPKSLERKFLKHPKLKELAEKEIRARRDSPAYLNPVMVMMPGRAIKSTSDFSAFARETLRAIKEDAKAVQKEIDDTELARAKNRATVTGFIKKPTKRPRARKKNSR